MASTPSKIIPARPSPGLQSAAQAVAGIRQTAKTWQSEPVHRPLPAEGVAEKQRLKKTDRTTTKIPVSNGEANPSERKRHTARCLFSTSEKGPRERHHQWELKVGNLNISSLRGNKRELADEVIKYQLDTVRLSSMKHQGSGLLNLSGWKPSYSVVDITTRAQAGVGVLVELNLAHRIIN
ncbi:unnamed protein product [Soboliphyme baturini]|uniref:Endonuclease/exonuclease/phosphatase domain-containing protein n=1 Tax=Soboliphyme baturini TaxID=241478 RepID=A0A183IRS6_9BILA|nr:unnamed protein product [Soboliphyme baturini]